MVKSWMKNASGLKVQQLDIQQQALKLTANRFIFIFLASRFWFFFSINVTAVHYIIPTFFFLYILTWLVMQYVWMPWVFQFKILCKATCRTNNSTSKINIAFAETECLALKQKLMY
jgi:hypothetical protein